MWRQTTFFSWEIYSNKTQTLSDITPSWITTAINTNLGSIHTVTSISTDDVLSKYFTNGEELYNKRRHLRTLIKKKNNLVLLEEQDDIYHICQSEESIKELKTAWKNYCVRENKLQNVINQIHNTISSPSNEINSDVIQLDALQNYCQLTPLPVWITNNIVTPLWVSLCATDNYFYSPTALPIYCSPPSQTILPLTKDTHPIEINGTINILLLGASNYCRRRHACRHSEDRELLTTACQSLGAHIVKDWHTAHYILWCFHKKSIIYSSHSTLLNKDSQNGMRRKTLGLAAFLENKNLNLIHSEWLWQSYKNKQFIPIDQFILKPFSTLLKPSNPVVSYNNLPLIDNKYLDDSFWTPNIDFKFSSFVYPIFSTSYVPKIFKSYKSLSSLRSLSSIPTFMEPPTTNTAMMESSPCKFNLSSTPAFLQTQSEVIAHYFLSQIQASLETKLSLDALKSASWVISSAFSIEMLFLLSHFMYSILGVKHVFISSTSSIILLPLLAEATGKLIKHSVITGSCTTSEHNYETSDERTRLDNDITRRLVSSATCTELLPSTILSRNMVCIAHISPTFNFHSLCGCALGHLHPFTHSKPIESESSLSLFQSLSPSLSTPAITILLVKETVDSVWESVEDFYEALVASVNITDISTESDLPLNPVQATTDMITDLNDNNTVLDRLHKKKRSRVDSNNELPTKRLDLFASLLTASLLLTDSQKHNGDILSHLSLDKEIIQSSHSVDPSVSLHPPDIIETHTAWNIILIQLGSTWYSWLKSHLKYIHLLPSIGTEDILSCKPVLDSKQIQWDCVSMYDRLLGLQTLKHKEFGLDIFCRCMSLNNLIQGNIVQNHNITPSIRQSFSSLNNTQSNTQLPDDNNVLLPPLNPDFKQMIDIRFKGSEEIQQWLTIEDKVKKEYKRLQQLRIMSDEERHFQLLHTLPQSIIQLQTLHSPTIELRDYISQQIDSFRIQCPYIE